MAVAIAFSVMPDAALAVAPTGNDRLCAVPGQGLAQGVSIIALVRDQAPGRRMRVNRLPAARVLLTLPVVSRIAAGRPKVSVII